MKYVTLIIAMLVASLGVDVVAKAKEKPVEIKTGLQSLPGDLPEITGKQSGVKYDFKLKSEQFYIYVPEGCEMKKDDAASEDKTPPQEETKKAEEVEKAGVIVFMSPYIRYPEVPKGWESVLEKEKLIYITPQNVSNKQKYDRKMGLAVTAAMKISELFEVDEDRIYLAGFDGGAQVACRTSYYHSDIFAGVIAICGAQFHEDVSVKRAATRDASMIFTGVAGFANAARSNVKYAIVTGSRSHRYASVLDIYEGGFMKEKFQAKLIAVPGMTHKICDGGTLSQALSFIGQGSGSTRKSGSSAGDSGNGMRTWTMSGGNKFDAKKIKHVGNYVYLKKSDGRELALSVFELSKEDQAYLKKVKSAK
jgi:hypothetical protein